MNSRRDFLKSTVLGAGALSLTPCLKAFGGTPAEAGTPKRFIFIRKSNGERPNEVALHALSAADNRCAWFPRIPRHEFWIVVLVALKER